MANKDNSGALFKAKANDNPNWPGYSGSATIDGKEYWISAWVKESDVAGKYFSMAYKPKDAEKPVMPTKSKQASPDEDIPF
jgi:hypothetical protein